MNNTSVLELNPTGLAEFVGSLYKQGLRFTLVQVSFGKYHFTITGY